MSKVATPGRALQAKVAYTPFWTGRLLDTGSSDWPAAARGTKSTVPTGSAGSAGMNASLPPKSDTQRVLVELHDINEPVPGHPPFKSTPPYVPTPARPRPHMLLLIPGG